MSRYWIRKDQFGGTGIGSGRISVAVLDSEGSVRRYWIRKDQFGGIGSGRISVAVLDSEGSVWRYWFGRISFAVLDPNGSVWQYWIRRDQCGCGGIVFGRIQITNTGITGKYVLFLTNIINLLCGTPVL